MTLRILPALVALVAGTLATAVQAQDTPERFRLWVEAGAAYQSRNDVQVPNDASGTRFSIQDAVGNGPFPAVRVDFAWALGNRHELRFLIAPFGFEERGTLPGTVRFNGATFSDATPTDITYRFDSYRATWRYAVLQDDTWTVRLGVTGKIRSAEIALSQNGIQSSRTDLGFVPLLHAYAERRLGERWRAILDFDGLASPQGRAVDIAALVGYDLSRSLTLAAGWRMLDGGADNDDVYNFARFNYATLSAMWRF
jgi:hypothetical protein